MKDSTEEMIQNMVLMGRINSKIFKQLKDIVDRSRTIALKMAEIRKREEISQEKQISHQKKTKYEGQNN